MSCWIDDDNYVVTGTVIVQMIVITLVVLLLLTPGHLRTRVHFDMFWSFVMTAEKWW